MQKIHSLLPCSESHRNADFQKNDVFSFITKTFFVFFSKTRFVQIVVHGLKIASAFDFILKKDNQKNSRPPMAVLSRLSAPHTNILLPTLLAGYLFYLGIFLVFIEKKFRKLLSSCFSRYLLYLYPLLCPFPKHDLQAT